MTTKAPATTEDGGSFWPVLRNRNFRLLRLGQTTSGLGDYFHMIAAPWMVLRLTNDSLALGTVLVSAFGVGLALMGLLSSTWIAALLMAIMGLGNGYVSIIFITFLQRRTPPDMMGRMMSLLLLTNVGPVPISQALAGAASKVSIEALFGVAGAFILAAGVWMGFQPALRLLDGEFAQASAPSLTP